MRGAVVLGALAALAGLACVGPKPLGPKLRPDQVTADAGLGANTLAANDLLEVRVYQEADLSGMYRVAPDGAITFPLCGKVAVGGLTPTAAAEAITACLKKDFLRRPQVSVMVKEFNSKKVFVFGEVSKPGAYAFEEGMTIIHAVSQAGGFSKTASKNSVNVTRVVDGQEVKVPVKVEDIVVGREKNFALQPGDIIFVPESFL
jgi:polysaccharide export outer membrane protein